MIAAWIAALKLGLAIIALPGVRVTDAAAFAIVAVELCPDPALCAAIGWGESRFRPVVVNARTGTWGVLQVSGGRPRLLTMRAGVAAGVRKLEEAAAYCRHRGPVCLVAVYGAGNGWRSPLAQRRARAVLRRAERIRGVS